MKIITKSRGEAYQPEPDWKRVSLAGSSNVSVEYFEKPAGHTSPLHTHPSEQVTILLQWHMKVVNGAREEAILGMGDSAYFEANEPHRIENPTEILAIGVDIFYARQRLRLLDEETGEMMTGVCPKN
jgi:quercetin dioxygenase-like cupin family protein